MIQPSLQIGGGDWAVKETKLLGTNPLLNEKLPVEIDVTNATIGTRVNEQGIIENGPRNLLTFSETFDNAVWVKNNTVVLSTNNVNPFGKLNATSLGFTLQNNPNFQQALVTVPNKVFTTSFYVRRVSGTAIIYLRAGNLTQNNINPTSVWQRFSVTGTSDSTIGRCVIGAVTPVIGVDVIEIWGAQLEEGSVATEYYPTTTRKNLARIDYSSGEAALLIEPQSTNIKTYSEAIVTLNEYRVVSCSLITVSILNPSALNSCNLFVLNSGGSATGQEGVNFGNASLANLTKYTQSIFVKPFGTDVFRIRSNSNGSVYDFTLTGNGEAPATSGILEGATIELMANSWYRCSWTFTTTSTVPGNRMDAWVMKTSIANGTDGMYVWGAQLEVGSYATSYIPTVASAVTRNTDVISKTGISDLINSEEGTFFVDTRVFADDGVNRVISLSDGTGSNRISITFHITSRRIQVVSTKAGGILFNLEILTAIKTNFNKIALVFNNNSAKFFINGVLIQQSPITSSYAVGTLTKLSFDAGTLSVLPFDGQVQSLQLYKTALTDAQLITLTTI